MKTDNSRSREEKYQEGYISRCNELVHANLFVVENNLYELTDEVRFKFEGMYRDAKFNGELQAIALDYLQENGKCLNTNIHGYNY